VLPRQLGEFDSETNATRAALVVLYRAWGRFAEAEKHASGSSD
jgi:hypothetical protein